LPHSWTPSLHRQVSTKPGQLHYFVREELERELVAAGFRITFYSDSPVGHAVARWDDRAA